MSTTPAPTLTMLEISNGNSRALLSPELGGQTLSWQVDGEELLHLDPDHVANFPKLILWGNPVLFPAPGLSIVHDRHCRWIHEGRELDMPFHGFADKVAWTVREATPSSVTFQYEPDSARLSEFPFRHRILQTISVATDSLHHEFTVENLDTRPIPYGLGWHPYFKLLRNASGSPRPWFVSFPDMLQWNDHGKPLKPWSGRVISSTERVGIGTVLVSSTVTAVTLRTDDPSLGTLEVSTRDFTEPGKPMAWVVWNIDPGADYLCVEPWSCPPNVLNDPANQRLVPPGSRRSHAMACVRQKP